MELLIAEVQILIQSIIPLTNRGALRLTTAKYYLPSGSSISEVGVTPDITVKEKDKKADAENCFEFSDIF